MGSYLVWTEERVAILQKAYASTAPQRNKNMFWRAVADRYHEIHPFHERRGGPAIQKKAGQFGWEAKTLFEEPQADCDACKGPLGRRTRTGLCEPCYLRQWRRLNRD